MKKIILIICILFSILPTYFIYNEIKKKLKHNDISINEELKEIENIIENNKDGQFNDKDKKRISFLIRKKILTGNSTQLPQFLANSILGANIQVLGSYIGTNATEKINFEYCGKSFKNPAKLIGTIERNGKIADLLVNCQLLADFFGEANQKTKNNESIDKITQNITDWLTQINENHNDQTINNV